MATDRAAFEVHMIDAYGPHINLARTPHGLLCSGIVILNRFMRLVVF